MSKKQNETKKKSLQQQMRAQMEKKGELQKVEGQRQLIPPNRTMDQAKYGSREEGHSGKCKWNNTRQMQKNRRDIEEQY